MDWTVKILMVIFGLVLILFIICIPIWFWNIYETNKHCAKWEEKTVWQEAYTSYIMSGKVMVPIHHKAEWIEKSFCTQPR